MFTILGMPTVWIYVALVPRVLLGKPPELQRCLWDDPGRVQT